MAKKRKGKRQYTVRELIELLAKTTDWDSLVFIGDEDSSTEKAVISITSAGGEVTLKS
ncbi:MAG: hypothetical protein J7L15_08195 [Clostridiales bacterium]|nr:hypothetical protein [Clostridiales bacterium]